MLGHEIKVGTRLRRILPHPRPDTFNSNTGFAAVGDVVVVDKLDYFTVSSEYGYHGIYYKLYSRVVYDCVYEGEDTIPAWEIVN